MIEGMVAFCRSGNLEELHHVRVEIKKIRALLSFTGNKKTKHLKPVKKVFKHAGVIRNAHLSLQLAVHYRISNRDLKNRQIKLFAVKASAFCRKLNRYLKNLEEPRQYFQRNFSDIKTRKVILHCKEQLRKSAEFLKNPGPENLHEFRKEIKKLLYIHKVMPRSIVKKLKINKVYFDKLQELIGKWHDTHTALVLLKTNSSSSRALHKLKKNKARLMNAVRSLSKDFRKKAKLKMI